MLTVAIINDTSPTHHYGCMLVMENLNRLLKNQNVTVSWTWPVGLDWRKSKRKIANYPKVDAIIVNGEGTIHHSQDRKYARALGEFALFADQILKTPIFLINATLYKNDSSLYKNLAFYKSIYVRDRMSLMELNENGLQGHYVPDLTFAKSDKIFRFDPIKKGCVIDTAFKEKVPQLIELSQKHNFDFRSMVVARPSNANFFKSPRPFIKNVWKWLLEDKTVSTEPSSYIRYLCNYEFVITGRYHTVTMCLKNKIPFLAIESNTPKISSILQETLGQTKRVVGFKDVEQVNLDEFKTYSLQELKSLDAFLDDAENAIDNMIATIVADIYTTSNNQNLKETML